MPNIRLTSPVKINLTLDILGKDKKRGKHFVNTILYRDDEFCDEISLIPDLKKKNTIHCNDPDIPLDETNTILRALELLGEKGWSISLTKNIPAQSGLGGGSSNAGVILKDFGEKKGIPEHLLMEMGKKIGADVPFFLLDDNLAYFEGFGDVFIQSWRMKPLQINYIETKVPVSTPEAYSSLDLETCGNNSSKTEALLNIFQKEAHLSNYKLQTTHLSTSLKASGYKLFHNDFESSFFKKNPEWWDKGHLCGSGGYLWSFDS